MKYQATSQLERQSHGFAAGMGDPSPMDSSHVHPDFELNLVYQGKVGYFIGGNLVEVRAGCIAMFWAGIPHRLVGVEEPTEFMWLNVPLVTVLRWELGGDSIRRLLGGEVLIEATDQATDEDFSRRWLRDLSDGGDVASRTVELEVQARVRRLAMNQRQIKLNASSPRFV